MCHHQPHAAPCRGLVVHGGESTGKSAVTEAVLERMVEAGADLRYAIVTSTECVTARHLLETIVAKVADALHRPDAPGRCENLSQLAVELARLLGNSRNGMVGNDGAHSEVSRFVLVFDAIDRQRDSPSTLLPALARLSETVRVYCFSTVGTITVTL